MKGAPIPAIICCSSSILENAERFTISMMQRDKLRQKYTET